MFSNYCCNTLPLEDDGFFVRRKREEFKRYIRRLYPPPKLHSVPLASPAYTTLTYSADINFEDFEKGYNTRHSPICGLRRDACLAITLLFLALGLYCAAMLFFQFQLYTNIRSKNMALIADFAALEFHWFYSIGTIALALAAINSYSLLEKMKKADIQLLSKEVISLCHDEFCMDVKDKLKETFLSFSRNLKKAFILSSDLTHVEMRKIYRTLHFNFDDVSDLINHNHKGAKTIYNEIMDASCKPRWDVWFITFLLPLSLSIGVSAYFVYHVFDIAYNQHRLVKLDSPQALHGQQLTHIMADEGLRYIGLSALLNLSLWLILLATASNSVCLSILRYLYVPIRSGAIRYCNNLISKEWEDVVVEGVVPFVLELKAATYEANDLVAPIPPSKCTYKTPLLAGSAPPPVSSNSLQRKQSYIQPIPAHASLEHMESHQLGINGQYFEPNGKSPGMHPPQNHFEFPQQTVIPPKVSSQIPGRIPDAMEIEMTEMFPNPSESSVTDDGVNPSPPLSTKHFSFERDAMHRGGSE